MIPLFGSIDTIYLLDSRFDFNNFYFEDFGAVA